jgi:2-iminobutanoate/2-iminopropanoate deaminase
MGEIKDEVIMMQKQVVVAKNAPQAIGPYSAGVRIGKFLYTAGQLGIDPTTGDFVDGGIEAQTRQALLNLKAVLEAGGSTLENVIKTTVFLRDMNEFKAMNGVYAEFFTEKFPARSAVEVARLPLDGAVEIEAVAVIPD